MKKLAVQALGLFHVLVGLVLLVGGAYLIRLDGSAFYFCAGLALCVTGALFARRQPVALAVLTAIAIATVLWSVWEVGFDFWGLVPRLSWILVLCILASLVAPGLLQGRGKRASAAVCLVLVLFSAVGLLQMFEPHGQILDPVAERNLTPTSPGQGNQWTHYGKNSFGTRYVDAQQITPANVKDLEVAWTFRTGHVAGPGAEDQNTPLQIDGTLYACTPYNKVIAIDGETGAEKWSFDPDIFGGNNTNRSRNRCRGLAYVQAEPAPVASNGSAEPAAALCRARIVLSTLDSRLIQLDAATGQVCTTFGKNGEVDLTIGMGHIEPYFYLPTSAPTVMRGKIIVGGWVWDNRSVDEPSGVVRAYDAMTGDLAWAWDLGNPDNSSYPEPGKTYTRTTPNVWSTPSFDDALGLIYLPTGNQTPDYWGGQRSPESEAHSSSVVALDIQTGKVRWKFQTTHHDLWDYDVSSQPLLYDIPTETGTVPALIQLTKRGQIFVLNRQTGEPVTEVVERPVPGGADPSDWTAPTQPYSVGMPAVGAEPLTEKRMWGASIIDQMLCRIEFKRLRYEGEFTPPSTVESLQYPGNFGGFNWGSGAIDERRAILYATDIRMAQRYQLVPSADFDAVSRKLRTGESMARQAGTPFAIKQGPLMSPLGIPCNQPPFGTMTAIDLVGKKIVWQRPIGTIKDSALPGGFVSPLPVAIGMPPMAGPVATASGLVFFAGTQDYYLRAFDSKTGEEVWKSRLPVGSNATPMSYTAPSGRQFIVINAGGAARSPRDRGDYIIAYALPAAR